MENELTIFEGSHAIVEPKRMNYQIQIPGRPTVELQRDVDFAKITKMKSISLLKPGAEKIVAAYGLLQHYTIESKIEDVSDNHALFYYLVRCDLCKIGANGQEYVFTSGYGSANSREKRNGLNSAFDSANASCKMACKRALVAAAINIAGLSGAFSQDIEDETFTKEGYEKMKATMNDNAPITSKQRQRIFAIGYDAGLKVEEIRQILASKGFMKTEDITQKDYDELCKLIGKKKEDA